MKTCFLVDNHSDLTIEVSSDEFGLYFLFSTGAKVSFTEAEVKRYFKELDSFYDLVLVPNFQLLQ